MLDLAKRQGWKQYIVTKNGHFTVHIHEGAKGKTKDIFRKNVIRSDISCYKIVK